MFYYRKFRFILQIWKDMAKLFKRGLECWLYSNSFKKISASKSWEAFREACKEHHLHRIIVVIQSLSLSDWIFCSCSKYHYGSCHLTKSKSVLYFRIHHKLSNLSYSKICAQRCPKVFLDLEKKENRKPRAVWSIVCSTHISHL